MATPKVNVLFDLPETPKMDDEGEALSKERRNTELAPEKYTMAYVKPYNMFTFRLFTVNQAGKRILPITEANGKFPLFSLEGFYPDARDNNSLGLEEFGPVPSSKSKFKEGKQQFNATLSTGRCNLEVSRNEIVARSFPYTCLAYKNDGLWCVVNSLLGGEGSNTELYCRNLYHKRPLHYGTIIPFNAWRHLPLQSITRGYVPSASSSPRVLDEKHQAMLRYVLNIYVHLPLSLLDPDPEGTIWAKKMRPATDGVLIGKHAVFIKHRPNVMFSPGLTWLASALTREAGHMVEPQVAGTGVHVTQEILRLFTAIIGPETLVQLLNEGNYADAAELWDKIRPIIMSLSDRGTPAYHSWWTLRPSPGSTIKRTLNSVREFERLVLEGGWPSLGTSMRDTYDFESIFRTHAATAKAWEGFIYKKCAVVSEKITKHTPLSKSVQTIKAKCEDHMAKIPWITG